MFRSFEQWWLSKSVLCRVEAGDEKASEEQGRKEEAQVQSNDRGPLNVDGLSFSSLRIALAFKKMQLIRSRDENVSRERGRGGKAWKRREKFQ